MKPIRKCLFPVAGLGTRFLPITATFPKEMLPLLNKPLLEYAVQEASSSNLSELIMVINDKKEMIRDYFSSDFEPNLKENKMLNETIKLISNCNFSFVKQKEMLGLGHAINCAEAEIDNEPFAVILPDDFCFSEQKSVIEQMIDVHKNNPGKCIVAVQDVDDSLIHKYGVVDINSFDNNTSIYKVKNMVEKPNKNDAPSNLAIIGRYILTPEIFHILNQISPDLNGEIQITEALKHLAHEGKVLAYKFSGKRIDCGSPNGYLEANNFLAFNKDLMSYKF